MVSLLDNRRLYHPTARQAQRPQSSDDTTHSSLLACSSSDDQPAASHQAVSHLRWHFPSRSKRDVCRNGRRDTSSPGWSLWNQRRTTRLACVLSVPSSVWDHPQNSYHRWKSSYSSYSADAVAEGHHPTMSGAYPAARAQLVSSKSQAYRRTQLRRIFLRVLQVHSHAQRRQFIQAFHIWDQRYGLRLLQRPNRGWVTSDLHRARSMLIKALPYMFAFLDDQKIPRSTNALEGYFARLKLRYRQHRGLSKRNRLSYFTWYFHLCPR